MLKNALLLFAPVLAALLGAGCASSTSPTPPSRAAAPAPSAVPDAEGWRSLFDGKTLAGWKESDFIGKGKVTVANGEVTLKSGYMTGITWANEKDLLRMNYELSLDAKRTEGGDFFCGLTFPVSTNPCTLVVGGWGGSLVGLSCLDGEDAANNETTKSMEFKQDRWYHVRVQVTPKKIRAWIDDEKLVDVETAERRISIRLEVEPCVPLGVATWSTTGVLRNFRVRPLPKEEL